MKNLKTFVSFMFLFLDGVIFGSKEAKNIKNYIVMPSDEYFNTGQTQIVVQGFIEDGGCGDKSVTVIAPKSFKWPNLHVFTETDLPVTGNVLNDQEYETEVLEKNSARVYALLKNRKERMGSRFPEDRLEALDKYKKLSESNN
jgi:hypothetical protein